MNLIPSSRFSCYCLEQGVPGRRFGQFGLRGRLLLPRHHRPLPARSLPLRLGRHSAAHSLRLPANLAGRLVVPLHHACYDGQTHSASRRGTRGGGEQEGVVKKEQDPTDYAIGTFGLNVFIDNHHFAKTKLEQNNNINPLGKQR